MLTGLIFAALLPTLIVVVIIQAAHISRKKPLLESDTLSFIGSMTSSLFTISLAFYVAFAWQARSSVSTDSSTEANALLNSFWQAGQAPEPARSALLASIRSYADQVAELEWPRMIAGRESPQVDATLATLRSQFTALPDTQDAGGDARRQGLLDIQTITNSRRARIGDATGDHEFNAVLLAAAFAGGFLVIAYPLLVGLARKPIDVILMAIMTASISMVLYFCTQLLEPLRGPFAVGPDAIQSALLQMRL